MTDNFYSSKSYSIAGGSVGSIIEMNCTYLVLIICTVRNVLLLYNPATVSIVLGPHVQCISPNSRVK